MKQMKTRLSTILMAVMLLAPVQILASETDKDHSKEAVVSGGEGAKPHSKDEHDDHGQSPDAKKDDHDGDHGDGHEKKGSTHSEKEEGLRLNERQMQEAGIVLKVLEPSKVATRFLAPGEIKLNSYRTQIVTPRIPAMVMVRHAAMGDIVRAGQSLATLFSVEMAQAQGDFVVAKSEWDRVRKLGEKLVSEKRATEAQVNYQQARARLLAYGLTGIQIAGLSISGSRSNPGQFDLLAEQDGLIIWDEFQIGEMIEPGRPLYKVTDPLSRWVEARINPEEAETVSPGDEVRIAAAGKQYRGIVALIHQSIDEQTRTLGVRIEISDLKVPPRPGQFVDVIFEKSSNEEVLAVPKHAVLRNSEGKWTVYRKSISGTFEAVEVEILRETENVAVIQGLSRGVQVAVQGAFFIQSEIAKSGFDIHNH